MSSKKKARCFADGGIIGSDGMTDTQRAKRNAVLQNLGMSTAPVTQSAPPQVTQPVPQPVQQPGSMIQRAAGILGGRREQIDKASGYANGGIVRGKGGVDRVPMAIGGVNVNLTGGKKPEAVLPGKTVEAMGGPSAVESLIEATNGKPPVKGGLKEGGNYRYGANGEWIPDPEEDKAPAGGKWATPNMPIPVPSQASVANDPMKISNPVLSASNAIDKGLSAVGNVFVDSAAANRGGIDYATAKANRVAAEPAAPGAVTATPAAPEGNPLVPQPFSVQSPFGATPDKMTMPGDSPAGKAIILGPNDGTGGGFTADSGSYNVNQTSQPGVQRVTGAGKSPLYTNINPADAVAGLGNQPVGGDAAAVNEGLKRHAEMIANRDKDIPAGGYGPGILGDGSLGTLPGGQSIEEWNRNVGVKTQLGLSPKDRVAYEDAAAKNEVQRRGQDFNRETSLNNSGLAAQVANNRDQVTMRGQDINERGDRLRYGNPLDIQAKQLSLTQAQRLSDIQGKYLNGTPEEKARAAEQIRALSGKDNQQSLKDNFMTAGGGQEFDEKAGIMRNVPQRLIDLRTGQDVSGQQQGPKRIGNSPYDEGASIVGKDGKKYVVRNGQPVLAQ